MLKEGITGYSSIIVSKQDTALTLKSGGLRVLATPALVALMERAAFDSVEALMEPGQTTVGTYMEIRHISATPEGVKVNCRSRLVKAEGKKLTFEIEAADNQGTVGAAVHKRYIVDSAVFIEKANEKKED